MKLKAIAAGFALAGLAASASAANNPSTLATGSASFSRVDVAGASFTDIATRPDDVIATSAGPTSTPAATEPETYLLALAGLGAIGFLVRRRGGSV
jgi:MYXO-CTERM domain-containing protein